MKRVVILLFFLTSSIIAQVEYSEDQQRPSAGFPFYVDAANYNSTNDGQTRIDFFIEVPNSSIQFIKRGDNYYASYNVSLTFWDKDKKNILSDRSWKEQVEAPEFSQTTSKNNYNLSYRTYDFKPGEYNFRCTIEDNDSRRTSSREFPFIVKQVSDTLGISDAMLIARIMKDSHGETVMPNVSKTVSNKIDSLPFYFETYSNKERSVTFEYILNDLQSATAKTSVDHQNIKAGRNTIYHTLKDINFQLGSYILTIILKDSDMNEVERVQKKFYSQIAGLPSNITDLDKAVRQLLYIASPEEGSYIEDAKDYDEKLSRFMEFWNSKKPNPRTDDNPILYEYYRRIDYATKNFKGLSEGWRSDMGMIYVTFGPPSNVERHPFDSNSRPYEIWDYYELNREFVFLDQTGFGDYRLVNPDYSRWPGYRQ